MRLALRNNQLSIKFTYSVTFTFPLPAKPGFVNFGTKKWYKIFFAEILPNYRQNINLRYG